ncbi:hypothetical protein JTE90_016710 [Oedothorax gibbosus]|uniref:Uncharacterized protein n=1 Tax=Oedothorax gibbosus TaxID=931172 RepID=A0AAV6V2Z8_9ARAC|nr:hypothetical protein JTE90_016710 [Oedothorax gibbosus]
MAKRCDKCHHVAPPPPTFIPLGKRKPFLVNHGRCQRQASLNPSIGIQPRKRCAKKNRKKKRPTSKTNHFCAPRWDMREDLTWIIEGIMAHEIKCETWEM